MGFSNVFPISCLFLSQLNGKHTISTHSYYGVISFVFSRLWCRHFRCVRLRSSWFGKTAPWKMESFRSLVGQTLESRIQWSCPMPLGSQAVPGSRHDIFYKNCLPGTVEIYVFVATPPFFCWWDQILWIQPFPRVGSCFSRSQELNKPCHPRPSRASWCNPMSWGTFTIRRCEVKKTPGPYLLAGGCLQWGCFGKI